MGSRSSPAPAPTAPPPAAPTALPETPDNRQEPGARGVARRLNDLGMPSQTATPINSGATADPLGGAKTLTGGNTASMMG